MSAGIRVNRGVKVIAVVSAAAICLYQLLRRNGIEAINELTDMATDKIANLFLPGSTEARIYDAAIQRLNRKFKTEQAVTLAKLMVAQSKFETGNYTSNAFKKAKNAFGYGFYAGSLYQTGGKMPTSDDVKNLAMYKDVADSAREVADWIGRREPDFRGVKNQNDYAQALKFNGYFTMTAQAYAQGIQSFLKA